MDQPKQPLLPKDLINFLFDTITHPDGRPYTALEVADQVSISYGTINQLRSGRITKPTLPTLRDIYRFFDVPLDFFNCTSFEECYVLLARGRVEPESPAAEIAYRAARLLPEIQQQLLCIIGWAEAYERKQARKNAASDEK